MFGNPQATRGTANILIEGLIGGVIAIMTFLVLGLLVGTVSLVWKGLKFGYVAIRGSGSNANANTNSSMATSLSTSVVAPPSPPPNMPVQALLASAQRVEVIEAGELKRIDLKGAFVSVRYYSATNTAKAKLTVSSRSLQKRLGPTVQLQEQPAASLVEASEKYREEAQALLDGAAPKPKVVTKVGNIKPVAADEQTVVGEAVPTSFVSEPYPFDIPFPDSYPYADSYPEPPSESFDEPVQEAKEPRIKRKRPPRSKVTYRGVFVEAGTAERSKGNRTFSQFRVLLHDDTLHAEIPLWGTDLERAVAEAGVLPGDRIEAGIVGDTQVLIRGESMPKVIWTVSKI